MLFFALVCHLVIAMKRAPEGDDLPEARKTKIEDDYSDYDRVFPEGLGGGFADDDDAPVPQKVDGDGKSKEDLLSLLRPTDAPEGVCTDDYFIGQVQKLIKNWDGNRARWLWLYCGEDIRLFEDPDYEMYDYLFLVSSFERDDLQIIRDIITYSENTRAKHNATKFYLLKHRLDKVPDSVVPDDIRRAVHELTDEDINNAYGLVTDLGLFLLKEPVNGGPFSFSLWGQRYSDRVVKVAFLIQLRYEGAARAVQTFFDTFGDHYRVLVKLCNDRGIRPEEYLSDKGQKALVSLVRSPCDNPKLLDALHDRYLRGSEQSQMALIKLVFTSGWAKEKMKLGDWIRYLRHYPNDPILLSAMPNLHELTWHDFDNHHHIRAFANALLTKYLDHRAEIIAWLKTVLPVEVMRQFGYLPQEADKSDTHSSDKRGRYKI